MPALKFGLAEVRLGELTLAPLSGYDLEPWRTYAARSSSMLISKASIVERTSSIPECAFTIFKKCPQGLPPHATYLFKHALVQDAAYGALLREPRRALHARIADTLESQFTEIADSRAAT
jgi:hypothetical protein